MVDLITALEKRGHHHTHSWVCACGARARSAWGSLGARIALEEHRRRRPHNESSGPGLVAPVELLGGHP